MRSDHGKLTPTKRFARNAIMLIAVNLLMRTVGVSFNIYVSNRAGGEVMGLYSLLSGAYAFALTLGCGGINLGTTRMIADTIGKFSVKGSDTFDFSPECRTVIRKALSRCLLYSLILSTVTGTLLFCLAGHISAEWLGDGRTATSLRVLALTLPPIALSSCLGGYFTAVRRVSRNAAVSVIGQLARIFFCARLLSIPFSKSVEGACLAIVIGGALSELISFVLTFIAYGIDKRQYLRSEADVDKEDTHSLTSKLLGITVPVTLSACLRSGLITFEHMLIPRGLKKSGATWAAALSSYGVLSGMVLPVVLFPSAFISSFSGLLVPEIAESNAASDSERVARISQKIITPALVFSFGVAGIMSCFSNGLGLALYNSAEAGRYIRMLAPLIPIMYVDSSVDAVLKGMGEQVYSMNVNIADALASVILVWILTPRLGLYGYIITIYFTEILNTTLSLTKMLSVSKMRVNLWQLVFGPLIAVLGVCCFLNIVLPFLMPHLPIGTRTGEVIFSICTAAVLYIAVLPLVGVIRKSDVKELKGIVK